MTDVREILGGSPSPAEDARPVTPQQTVEGATPGCREYITEPSESRNVVSSTVPSGYTIHYCADPREYRIGETWETATPVPSVSNVKEVLANPALIWWGQGIGVDGVLELLKRGLLGAREDWDYLAYEDPQMSTDYGYWPPADKEKIVKLLTENKITVNHVRDSAATRGTNVHRALESWAVTGQLANPDDFPAEEQGYVKSLNAFLAATDGKIEPVHSELMVGSKEHGFAGRFDLVARVLEPLELKTGPRTTRTIPAGEGIFDLKTRNKLQKRMQEFLQLSAYRLGYEESGYGRSQFEYIIQVTPEGRYDITVNEKRPDHFLSVLNTWRALR